MTTHTGPPLHVLQGPNPEVLEAQARVCTGPTQTRPLGVSPRDPDPDRILTLILDSLRGHIEPARAVSVAQMGAFFAAMTLRRRFPPATRWSPAEEAAVTRHAPTLRTMLPPTVLYLFDPSVRPACRPGPDTVLCDALRHVLAGHHLTCADTRRAARAALDPAADPALAAALVIGQRMNRETYDEFRGYLDAVRGPEDVVPVRVPHLLHVGEPYNGSTRYFKPTLFVAAVRASVGRATVLHGVDRLPPKLGVTEESILSELGAGTRLTPEDGVSLLEDPAIGFVYLSQREFAPHAYAASALRTHIQKRPPWAATEKAQQIYATDGQNHMVIGTYHPGYEEPQLRSMRERGISAGAVIKGEEGTSQCGLRLGKPSGPGGEHARWAVNHVQGFRHASGVAVDIECDIEPAELGLHYHANPRVEPITPEAFARAGRAALAGERGHVYDRIALNAAVLDTVLGLEPDLSTAFAGARKAIDGGHALARLDAYVAASSARC